MTLLVFTDLDGSLMEHETYSIQPAHQALEELEAREIPLILNSSKTAAEMETVQALLGIQFPFICENGAALHRPGEEIIEFGARSDKWMDDIRKLRIDHGYAFEGFSDWSVNEVSSLTGLTLPHAEKAMARFYSEPILWQDSESALAKFRVELQKMNLRLLQGGRFQSIQGLFDKSDALRSITSRERELGHTITTVALGDSPNDAAMLNAADIAVIIKSEKSNLIHCPDAQSIIHTRVPGPTGWNEAILEILERHDSGRLQN